MEAMLTLTPEQLYFLGTVMNAEHINYAYIAALSELQRNYSRTRRKCLDELVLAGILRERLSGELLLRPAPKKLLNNLFFGKKETELEVFTLDEKPSQNTVRFHWSEDSVTRVNIKNNRFEIFESSVKELEALVQDLVTSTEYPILVSGIQKDAVTRIITAKQATVGVGSKGTVLFEQHGGRYMVDSNGTPTGVPASQAKVALLSELKGE